jgi:Ca-activated chloride channel family protein
MDLLWPGFLLLLGLIPVLVGLYIWMLRRRRRYTVRYSSLSLVRDVVARQSRLRRHLPFALFLAALASLVMAASRPVSIVSIPTNQTTIILAMDVSESMRSADISPSRLGAAEAAALSFVQNQKPGTQIGIVAFAGFAELIQPPTTDQQALKDAIESLITSRRTAIGSSILKSIDTIAVVDQTVAPSTINSSSGQQPIPVAHGAYVPEIIVILTDGVSNAGPLPLDAAQQAVDRGVRIYTIGFGTENGSVQLNGGQSRGGGGGNSRQFGGGFRAGIDEATLKQVADMTGGDYYAASSADELMKVFNELPTNLITRHETTEISFGFVLVGALLAAAAIILSQLWHPLP